MKGKSHSVVGRAVLTAAVGGLLVATSASAQSAGPTSAVTFTKDIAPLLQRSCQTCHRPDGVGPMSLITYDEVRPWARAIKTRTGLRDKAGVMPPWYVERNIGIQHYKDDPSLAEAEIVRIAEWVDNGAPQGNPADMPAPLVFADERAWRIGAPDLIVKTADILVKAGSPDWWGEIESIPTGLTEDRYVSAVEIKEVNDVDTQGSGRQTVGGRFVFHHLIWSTRNLDENTDPSAARDENTSTGWPVHEVGRNPDYFDPKLGRLLRAGSSVVSNSAHLHSNGRDTVSHLLIGFKFHPKGYTPEFEPVRGGGGGGLANGIDIDIKPMRANQELHAYSVLEAPMKIITFEPHLHAPGARMCLEAIWGINIEVLTCAGYDHNWVRGYAYDDDYAPLLPKGTVLHITGYMDNTPNNKNIPDPRNWQGSGNRSVSNMFMDLGMRVSLTEEQFQKEVEARRQKFNLGPNDHLLGCPICNDGPQSGYRPVPGDTTQGGQQGNQ